MTGSIRHRPFTIIAGRTMVLLGIALLCCSLSYAQQENVGWQALPGTRLTDVCPERSAEYNFPDKCHNVVRAWSSGALDQASGNLYIWGGGHNDYYGNELYALNAHSKTLERLTEPAPIANPLAKPVQGELAPFDGTQPNARHTYDGMTFMASEKVLWAFSGALAGRTALLHDNKTWLFYPGENSWRIDEASGDIPDGGYGVVSAYDAVTGKIFLHNRKALYSYTLGSEGGVYKRLNGNSALGLGVNAAIDPKNRRMLIIGNGTQILYDLDSSSGYRRIRFPRKGDADFIRKHDAPGLAYNSRDGHFYAWAGDGKLYRFHMDSLSWESLALKNDPGAQGRHGTFGRFDYLPSIDSFVLLHNPRKNAYLLTLPEDDDTQPPAAPGALKASFPYPGALSLGWQASDDNFGVAGYRVFINGELSGETTRPSFKSMAFEPEESLSIQIQAFDSAGNESRLSQPMQLSLPVELPRMRLGDCQSEKRLGDRDDIVYCESWDKEDWWKNGWLRDAIVGDPRPMTAKTKQHTRIVDEGCLSGKCLEVSMKKGQKKALSAFWPLAEANLAPERIFMRYHFKLGENWDINMCRPDGKKVGAGGKFPGLADIRSGADPSGQCGNGGAASDGINCWSMRLNYRNCASNDGEACSSKTDPAMRLGSYLYHPLQGGSTGSVGHWDSDDWNQSRKGSCDDRASNLFCGKGDGGVLERGRWYAIEMQVDMNTPGKTDGVIRGWVDGVLSYEKTNMMFRRKGHDFLHNRLAWFNIYKGGVNGNCETSNVYFDQLVIALDRPVGGLDSDTAAPPLLEFSALPIAPSKAEAVQLQWSSENATQCLAGGLWAGEKATSGWETLEAVENSATLRLDCTGPGGKVIRKLSLRVDGKAADSSAPTVILSAPQALHIESQQANYLQLSWDPAPASEEIVTYRVLIDDKPGNETADTSALIRNLLPGTELELRVQAVDKNGNRSPSSEALRIEIPPSNSAKNEITLYPDADTYLAGSTFKALGSTSRLSLSRDRNILLRFPVELLPVDAEVSAAKLVLRPREQFGDVSAALFLAAHDWSELAASRDFIDNSKRRWAQKLGDWVDAAGQVNGDRAFRTVKLRDNGAKQALSIDVTALVKQWRGGQTNHGMILVHKQGRSQDFFSKESNYPERWPRLEITLKK